MEIQQHDGVVVDVAGCRQGVAELLRERERCSKGGGRRPRLSLAALPPPPLYRPPGRGAPAKSHLGWGGGQGGCLAPQGKWEAPPP